MRIRDELLRCGYSHEYVDEIALLTYNDILNSLPKKKNFFDTKIGKFLSTDWCDLLIDKLALYYYEKEKMSEQKKLEFTGDKNNPVDVYEYNARNGIMPDETRENEDGSYTYTYDGVPVTVKVNLTSIFEEGFLEKYEIRKKRLLADYLNIDEDVILNMSEEEIEALVAKRMKNEKKNKEIKLTNIQI